MKVVNLVPRRADHGRRDRIWSFVRGRWEGEHPTIPIFEGHDDGPGKFNRSLAVNLAAKAAGDWDVAVISDSDTFVQGTQLQQAIDGSQGPCSFWLAYDVYYYLSRRMSDLIMDGYTGSWFDGNGVEFPMTGTCSSMVVVTRDLWETVGGFDEGFEGWGFEDVAFSLACQAFGGGVNRSHGPVWHLHHNTSPENNSDSPEWNANRARMLLYGDARDAGPEAMRKLLNAR